MSTAAPRPSHHGSGISASGLTLVIGAQVSIQVGAATATTLFPVLGPIGTVSLRLIFSAVLLMAVLRPNLRGLGRKAWVAAALLGVALTAMNNLIYLAFDRIPLGIAATIEILGPLALAVAIVRRPVVWFLATMALIGVWLLSGASLTGTTLDPLGILYALLAGVSWIGYILFSRGTAQLFRGADGLAVAMLFAAALAVPIGLVSLPSFTVLTDPRVLLFALAVAALSSALPYALEQLSLRKLPAETFAMLMSIAPAVAAVVGYLLLGQALTLTDLAGIALVTIATAVAMRLQSKKTS